ncbi:pollen-specific leucine-rich repeat extensin-like protein 4 [Helianthus annuus]|uniref:pollen-specific leucine-rich repeat extensin-like protein 4 n=1 Tax=Helianthus annuus TaxID=4232 RepID=UPI000B8F6B62|nr:pollen-specific leucine-rich repeat extensin-like protein 4 [Helianthus annuus]
MPAEPVITAPVQIPTPPHTPVHAPTDEPIQAPVLDGSTDRIRLMRFTPTSLPTRHPDEAGPSGHAHIPPGETDPYYPPQVPVEHLATHHSLPHVVPTADPYHPSHYPGVSTDDLILSLQVQIDILFTKLHELLPLAEARPPPPPVHSPPHAPPPPPELPLVDLRARVVTLEQQIDLLIRRVHELEDEVTHLHSIVLLTPPPIPLHHRRSLAGYLL